MKKYRLFHLNIEWGKLLPEIINYIRANDFDILCLQEVTGGEYTLDGKDKYKQLEEALPEYAGELVRTSNKPGDQQTYMGNAIFLRNGLEQLSKDVVWMHEYAVQEIRVDDPHNSELGNAVLALTLNSGSEGDLTFTVATGHFMWEKTPGDTEVKIARAKKVSDYLAALKDPFILTGDFNVGPLTRTSSQFGKIASNLSVEAGLTNTLNPGRSRHKHLFPPGIMCDYIFTSPKVKVHEFKLIDTPELSDHFGLSLEFSV